MTIFSPQYPLRPHTENFVANNAWEPDGYIQSVGRAISQAKLTVRVAKDAEFLTGEKPVQIRRVRRDLRGVRWLQPLF